jgi:hypothetical protein
LKTGNRVDECAGKRDSQLKPVAVFDLICVIYILPRKFDRVVADFIPRNRHGAERSKRIVRGASASEENTANK